MGYTASLCEVPVDNVCDSNPCRNGGSCHLSSLSNYTCTCPVGWKGKLVTFFARKRTVTWRLLWIESVTEYYFVRYLYVHILWPYGFLSVLLLFVLKNIKWGFFVFLLLGKCFLSQKQHLFALYSCCRYRYLLLYIFQCCKPYGTLNFGSTWIRIWLVWLRYQFWTTAPPGGADHTVKL